jgi:hypothetical protein
MPEPIPLPSIVWPLRSIVMFGAPITMPSQMQSVRSFMTRVLVMSFWPQKTLRATGGALTSHVCVAGELSAFSDMSTARTRNSCDPTARPATECGDVQAAHAEPSSEHWNVAVGSSLENVNVQPLRTVSGSGSSGPSSVGGAVVSDGGAATVHV